MDRMRLSSLTISSQTISAAAPLAVQVEGTLQRPEEQHEETWSFEGLLDRRADFEIEIKQDGTAIITVTGVLKRRPDAQLPGQRLQATVKKWVA